MGRWHKWASWTNFVTALFFVAMCARAWEMWIAAPEWFKSALSCAALAYVVRLRLAHLGPPEVAS